MIGCRHYLTIWDKYFLSQFYKGELGDFKMDLAKWGMG